MQSQITEEDARQQIRAQVVMIGASDAINHLETCSHHAAFANVPTFAHLMRGRGCGGVKCFNPKENRLWLSTLGDDPKDRVQLMGMLFFATTKLPLKSTGWVVSDEVLDKHKTRLAPFM